MFKTKEDSLENPLEISKETSKEISKESQFALSMRLVIFGMGVCGVVIYTLLFPKMIPLLVDESYFLISMICMFLALTPCYGVLYYGLKLAKSVEKGIVFSLQNSKDLKAISNLALIDTIYFVIANIIFYLLGISYTLTIMLSLFVDFFGIIVFLAGRILSHFIFLASEIKEENEGFI